MPRRNGGSSPRSPDDRNELERAGRQRARQARTAARKKRGSEGAHRTIMAIALSPGPLGGFLARGAAGSPKQRALRIARWPEPSPSAPPQRRGRELQLPQLPRLLLPWSNYAFPSSTPLTPRLLLPSQLVHPHIVLPASEFLTHGRYADGYGIPERSASTSGKPSPFSHRVLALYTRCHPMQAECKHNLPRIRAPGRNAQSYGRRRCSCVAAQPVS